MADVNAPVAPIRIKLEANDGTVVDVDLDVALKSRLISGMLEGLHIVAGDPLLNDPFPISQVDGNTLNKLLEYCRLKRGSVYQPKRRDEDPRIVLTAADEQFMDVPHEELAQILKGANFMDIPEIMDIITQKIANMAIGKTVEELREVYGLDNDFTEAEEKAIRSEFDWAGL